MRTVASFSATSCFPTSASTRSTYRSRARAGRGDAGARRLPARRDRPKSTQLPAVRPRRDRLQPARRRLLRHGPGVARCHRGDRRGALTRRTRDGGPLRAPLPGMARGLPPHGPTRALHQLRGVHPHRRLDVQPAREMAEDHASHPLAPTDRVAELPAQLARLASGPQRLLPSGSGLHRPCREQEGRGDPGLPAARRQYPPLRCRPLPAEQELRQRRRRRQAAGAHLPLDGRGDRPLLPRPWHLGMGFQRRGRRPGRRAGLLRGRADARSPRGGSDPPRAAAGPAGQGRQRRRPDAPPAGQRAPARLAGRRVRLALHRRSPHRLRLPRLPDASPPADVPAHESREPARAGLQGGGHDDDSVRHGHAERPRPVPPREGRHRPGPRAGGQGSGPPTRRWTNAGCEARAWTRSYGEDHPDVRDWAWPF